MNEADEIEKRISRVDVANLLVEKIGVSYRSAYEGLIFTKGFPKPVLIPSPSGGKPMQRWIISDVLNWIVCLKKAA